jgi:hypothetical protein
MEEYIKEDLFSKIGADSGANSSRLAKGERLIRVSLMAGFFGVLALEAWLLWQVWLLF